MGEPTNAFFCFVVYSLHCLHMFTPIFQCMEKDLPWTFPWCQASNIRKRQPGTRRRLRYHGTGEDKQRWLEAVRWMAHVMISWSEAWNCPAMNLHVSSYETPWDCAMSASVSWRRRHFSVGIPQIASGSAKRQMFGMSFFASSLQVMLSFEQVMFCVNFATWNIYYEFLVNKIVLSVCVVIQHVSEPHLNIVTQPEMDKLQTFSQRTGPVEVVQFVVPYKMDDIRRSILPSI